MKLVTLIAFLTTKNVGTGSPQYMQELKNYLAEQCESLGLVWTSANRREQTHDHCGKHDGQSANRGHV